jgi:hypothetical protein
MTERDEQGTIDDPEVPEEDALEQLTPAQVAEDDDDVPEEIDLEADPADVAEQSRSVGVEDDEYR